MALMVVAVLLTQSRQAIIGLVGAVFVLVFRSDTERAAPSCVLLLLVADLVGFVPTWSRTRSKSGQPSSTRSSSGSPGSRTPSTIWQTDPWFGVGLRWWYTDRFPVQFQPPNAEIEVLTTAGVVGPGRLHRPHGRGLGVAWELDPVYGSVALAVLVSTVSCRAQFDLFWAAVQGSLPFVVLGLCLGAPPGRREQRQRRRSRAGPDTTRASDPVAVA